MGGLSALVNSGADKAPLTRTSLRLTEHKARFVGYTTGENSRLTSDGPCTYEYDEEGSQLSIKTPSPLSN